MPSYRTFAAYGNENPQRSYNPNPRLQVDAPHPQWFGIGLCLIAGIAVGMQMGKSPIGIAAVQREFDIPLSSAALIASAFPLVGAFSALFMGSLTMRLGARRTLLCGLLIVAAGSAMSALAYDYPVVLAGRAIEGAGFLCATVAAPTMITGYANRVSRRLAMTLWSACIPIGISLTLILGPIVSTRFGWRGLWLAGSAEVVAVALCFAFMLPPSRAPSRSSFELRSLIEAFRNYRLLSFTVVAGAYMFLFSATALFPVMFVHRFGLKLSVASEITAPIIVSGLAGGLFVRHLLERGFPRAAAVAICAVILAVTGAALFGASPSLESAYCLCLAYAGSAGMLPAIAFDGSVAAASSPASVPFAMGMIMQASNIGVLIGPLIIGSAVHNGDWSGVPKPLLLACMVLLVVSMTLYEANRAPSIEKQHP